MTTETNRTAEIFRDTNNKNTINLGITTLCSMKCPKCSIGMPALMKEKKAYHLAKTDILDDLTVLTERSNLRRIHITGGEPTLHPEFKQIVDIVFGGPDNSRRYEHFAEYVTIETNGWGYLKYREVFESFDKVFITHYLADAMYKGSPDNTEIIETAQKDLGSKLIREPPVIHSTQHKTEITQLGKVRIPVIETPCSKWSNPGLPCGYYNRMLYPCCVSFGIDPIYAVPVTPNWRDLIDMFPKGCNRCCYQGT